MDPAAGHLVLGGGGVTVDPDINLQEEAWWLHSVFSCPLHGEASVSIPQYAGLTLLVEDHIPIPGNRTGARTSRPLPNLLMLLRRWYDVLWRLHKAGFCLLGNFTADNFLLYLATLDVRMTGNLHISRYSPQGGVLDHRCFAGAVRKVLTLRETIPPQISDWLELLDEGGIGDEYLIRYDIALMEPRVALSTLMSLRRKLEDLRRSDPRVFRLVMQLLAPFDNWHFTRCRNTLLHATRRYTERDHRRRGRRGPAFHPTARGLLTVIRHCSQHPGRRYEDLMLLIVDDDFRRFAAYFQRVMYNISQLRYLILELSM